MNVVTLRSVAVYIAELVLASSVRGGCSPLSFVNFMKYIIFLRRGTIEETHFSLQGKYFMTDGLIG